MFARLYSAIAGLTFILLPAIAFAKQIQQTPNWSSHHHMWNGPMWGTGMMFGPFLMLFVLALLIGLVFIAARRFGRHEYLQHTPHSEIPGPVDILKQRFASGEIDKADYEERLKILQG